MFDISEQVLQDVAARVARKVASGGAEPMRLPERYTLVALSGEGRALEPTLARLSAATGDLLLVSDCPAGAAGALATALARLPRAKTVAGEEAFDAGRLVSGAERVVAPSMDLALASRIASMQSDTPASRAILRALFAGIPVEVSLDERDFSVSPSAPEGARRALEEVVSRLGSLGITLSSPEISASAAPAAHPSQERFGFAEPLNEFVEFLENRPCMIEIGKPCVGCGACEARGF